MVPACVRIDVCVREHVCARTCVYEHVCVCVCVYRYVFYQDLDIFITPESAIPIHHR